MSSMVEGCGAWEGCILPAGHNRGQADVPENHLLPEVSNHTVADLEQQLAEAQARTIKAEIIWSQREKDMYQARSDWRECFDVEGQIRRDLYRLKEEKP